MANVSCYTSIDVPAGFFTDGCNKGPHDPPRFDMGGTYNRTYPPASNGAAGLAGVQSYGYQFNDPPEVFAGTLRAIRVESGYHPRWLLFGTPITVSSSTRSGGRVQWHVSAGGQTADTDAPAALETLATPCTAVIETLVDDGMGGFTVVWRAALVGS